MIAHVLPKMFIDDLHRMQVKEGGIIIHQTGGTRPAVFCTVENFVLMWTMIFLETPFSEPFTAFFKTESCEIRKIH